MAHIDLGHHYYDMGDYQNASKSYHRSRDYCSTSGHIIEMAFNVIKASLELSAFSTISSTVAKAEACQDPPDPILTLSKLKAAKGLAELDAGRYKEAAKCFVEGVKFEMAGKYNEVNLDVFPSNVLIELNVHDINFFIMFLFNTSILISLHIAFFFS